MLPTQQEPKTETNDDLIEGSFIDESKITFNQDDEGFSSLGDDEDDDAAEAEAIMLIQTQLKEIGALKLALA